MRAMSFLRPRCPDRAQCWKLLRPALAVVLAFAGSAKLLLALSPATPLTWPLGSPAGLAGIAALELLWASWLFLCDGRWRTWLVTVGLWLAFLAAAVYAHVIGQQSCHCFGRALDVAPKHTAAFDAAVLIALLLCYPTKGRNPLTPVSHGRGTAKAFAWASLVFCLFGAQSLLSPRGAVTSEGGLLTIYGRMVVLNPSRWVGRPFLGTPYTARVAEHFNRGDWLVLLYRPGCEACERVMPAYLAAAARGSGKIGTTAIGLCEVPDPSTADLGPDPATPAVMAKLSRDYDWVVPTPLAVRVSGGRVTGVFSGDESSVAALRSASAPPGP